jgi:methyltransferase-like protein/2-polyprenyl-3-methyl-5-hydroxy-6-metoxy-1,4-benzoquinol methylase
VSKTRKPSTQDQVSSDTMTQVRTPTATSYDEVPYDSLPYPQSHPDRLATIAALFGLRTAPVARCRVLEIGCASGGNLIPMAASLPDSHFVGVDSSVRQIADAQQLVDAMGLKNIELRAVDLTDLDATLGTFDYVIAHGVYSWIPDDEQEHLLSVCERALAPNGVAYISYNTYPGWHFRGMIRDMMLYHVDNFSDPKMRAAQARALLDFLVQSIQSTADPYPAMLRQNLDLIRRQSNSYLLHDHLEDVNDPIYFHQFVERAGRHGLQYLGESEFATMLANNFPKEVADTLQRIGKDLVRMEQYMDFLRNRSFRQTLLCRRDVQLKRAVNPDDIVPLLVAAAAQPVGNLDIKSTQPDQFRIASGATLTTSLPIVKAAIQYLAEVWPQAVPFEKLLTTARGRVSSVSIRDRRAIAAETQALGSAILSGYTVKFFELQGHQPEFVTEVTDRPTASALAREQARRGGRVTNQRHETVALDEFSRRVLLLLDGAHDRGAVLDEMGRLVTDGTLVVQQEGADIQVGDSLNAILGDAVERCLSRFAKAAVLVA